MHDGGINHIEVQPFAPVVNPVEMDEKMVNVIQKLQASEKYRILFKKAFGTETITTQLFSRAITQFQGLIYSYNSKYDKIKRNEKNIIFTESELAGYELFKVNCNSCHVEPLFSDFKYRNNGLSVSSRYKDSGRAHIDRLPENIYKFKTPSLRNVALTYPYMHDGRYSSIEDCLNHYTNKVTNKINLDPLLTNGLQLSDNDKLNLISFLNTLTDVEFIKDKRFANPN
jgi:cytochrome c peroxidase